MPGGVVGWRDVPAGHRRVLAGAMGLSFLVAVAYVVARNPLILVGDQVEYHSQGIFFTEGRWWWSQTPFGVAHPSAWKTPVYPAWVGLIYTVMSPSTLTLGMTQALLAPVTVGLSWLTARRLFGLTAASVVAGLVAVYPMVFEFYGLVFSEALSIPLTALVLWMVLGRPGPSRPWAAAVGVACAVAVLTKPSSLYLGVTVLVAWTVASGWRTAVRRTAVAAIAAAIVVTPWTIRASIVSDGFVPLSIQDGAAYGTFNREAATDSSYPYAWRPTPGDMGEILLEPRSDSEFRSELQRIALEYIRDHPESVPLAFFWNGITRTWDLRSPNLVGLEADLIGRHPTLARIGIAMYFVLLPLALVSLWILRHRREIILPVAATAPVVSLIFTSVAATRYRAPLEPLIVMLAVGGILARLRPPSPGRPSAQELRKSPPEGLGVEV